MGPAGSPKQGSGQRLVRALQGICFAHGDEIQGGGIQDSTDFGDLFARKAADPGVLANGLGVSGSQNPGMGAPGTLIRTVPCRDWAITTSTL